MPSCVGCVPELLASAGEGSRDNTCQTFPSQQPWEETSLPEAHGDQREDFGRGQGQASQQGRLGVPGSSADNASSFPRPSATVTPRARSPRTCLRRRNRKVRLTLCGRPGAGRPRAHGAPRGLQLSSGAGKRARGSPGPCPAAPLTPCRGSSGHWRPFGAQSPLRDGPAAPLEHCAGRRIRSDGVALSRGLRAPKDR